MQIPAAEVARGLRECIWAQDSAIVDDFLFFFMLFCVAYLWRSLNTARFSDDPHFFAATLSGGFCKNALFHSFDETCALRTYSVSMAFGDFRTQN